MPYNREREHQNRCLDCGKPCTLKATRCKSCAFKFMWRTGVRQKSPPQICIDCGKPCTFGAKRCKSCNTKEQWRTGYMREVHKASKRHSKGYILIYSPNHKRSNKNGFVLEHILVLEQKLGRLLKQGEVGHHLNGIKSDNRPQNLVALSDKKHKYILQAKAKRIQELEALLNGQNQLL